MGSTGPPSDEEWSQTSSCVPPETTAVPHLPQTADELFLIVPCPPPDTEYVVFEEVAILSNLTDTEIEGVKTLCNITEPPTTTTTTTTTTTPTTTTTLTTTPNATTTTPPTTTTTEPPPTTTSTTTTTTPTTTTTLTPTPNATTTAPPPTTTEATTTAPITTTTPVLTTTTGQTTIPTTSDIFTDSTTTSTTTTTPTSSNDTLVTPLTVSIAAVCLVLILLPLVACFCRSSVRKDKYKKRIASKSRGKRVQGQNYRNLDTDVHKEAYDNPTYRQSGSSFEMKDFSIAWELEAQSKPMALSVSTFKPNDSSVKNEGRQLPRIPMEDTSNLPLTYQTNHKTNQSRHSYHPQSRSRNQSTSSTDSIIYQKIQSAQGLPKIPIESVGNSRTLPNGVVANTSRKFTKPSEHRRRSPVRVKPIQLNGYVPHAKMRNDQYSTSQDNYMPYTIPRQGSYPRRKPLPDYPGNTPVSENRRSYPSPKYSHRSPNPSPSQPGQKRKLPRTDIGESPYMDNNRMRKFPTEERQYATPMQSGEETDHYYSRQPGTNHQIPGQPHSGNNPPINYLNGVYDNLLPQYPHTPQYAHTTHL